MSDQLPETRAACDGCGEELNLLRTHLVVTAKPQRQVLVSEEVAGEDPDEPPEPNIYLGTKAGAGDVGRVHNTSECLKAWVDKHDNFKMRYHKEDEIYVPEDNPDDEELAARAAEEDKRLRAEERERARVEAAMAEEG